MTGRRDVLPELASGNDFEVHLSRGNRWDNRTRAEFETRKAAAAKMFRNNLPTNDVFVLARVNKLPVPVVREIEAEYLQEVKRRAVK